MRSTARVGIRGVTQVVQFNWLRIVSWRATFTAAGLRPVNHLTVTPLVPCWVFRR